MLREEEPRPVSVTPKHQPMEEMNDIKEEDELEESPRAKMEKTGALELRPQIVRNNEEETG